MNETSGAICDVGYSGASYFRTLGHCPGCQGKNVRLIFESGWVGSRVLHPAKYCLTYFELTDGDLMWHKKISPDRAIQIINEYGKFQKIWDAAVQATGGVCIDCGNPSRDFYGMLPARIFCCCRKDHLKRLKAVQAGKQDMIFPEELVAS